MATLPAARRSEAALKETIRSLVNYGYVERKSMKGSYAAYDVYNLPQKGSLALMDISRKPVMLPTLSRARVLRF